MDDWKAKQAAKAAAAAALAAANPHLVPVSEKVNRLNAAAKNMRIELKRAFPSVKFSVKSSRFSGGDDIRVSWIDGPMVEQVDEIIDRYQGGDFDGMQDLYNYRHNVWIDAFGDAKYVFSQRNYSDAAVAGAIRSVKAKYAANLVQRGIEEISVDDFRMGRLWNVDVMSGANPMHDGLQALISRELQRRTWALNKSPALAAMVEVDEVVS